MKDYVFTKCLNPRSVFNPYTFEWVSVPCGHCKACLLDKSFKYRQLTTLEALGYIATYFITLTYDNLHLPKAYPVYDEDLDSYDLVDVDSGEVLASVFSSDYTDQIIEKFHSDYVPYLDKQDVQLFLKRLRKYYETKLGIKLRYFAVGEYGPKHFRPHYHLLLWFECSVSLPELEKVISEKWLFGRVDVQKAKGDAAKYVTGYANSFSFVPQLFKAFSKAKPFCTHSIRLGERGVPFRIESLLFNVSDRTDSFSVSHDGRIEEFQLSRAFIFRHVPRCIGLSYKDPNISYISYTILRYCQFFKYESLVDLAEQIFHFVNLANHNWQNKSKFQIVYDHFSRYFPSRTTYLHYTKKDLIERIINRIYRDLLCSKRFIDLADDLADHLDDGQSVYSRFPNRYACLFHYVYRFYKDRELTTLNNFYRKLETFSKKYETDIQNYNLYSIIYNQRYEEKIKGTELYNIYHGIIDDRFSQSIKHKYQNDLNNILLNN